ncbi:hypothetical protein [Halofilum ochraceum]|uniref:hypothetical protein n=1 Tax=Halofilum ochraceum TaxID=1611323 RepID=UPI0011130F85|nr:hypothetical protein [Halofilum ochraceum]
MYGGYRDGTRAARLAGVLIDRHWSADHPALYEGRFRVEGALDHAICSTAASTTERIRIAAAGRGQEHGGAVRVDGGIGWRRRLYNKVSGGIRGERPADFEVGDGNHGHATDEKLEFALYEICRVIVRFRIVSNTLWPKGCRRRRWMGEAAVRSAERTDE